MLDRKDLTPTEPCPHCFGRGRTGEDGSVIFDPSGERMQPIFSKECRWCFGTGRIQAEAIDSE